MNTNSKCRARGRFLTQLSALALLAVLAAAVPTAAQRSSLQLPPYKKITLPNGMTLLLMEQHEVPIINFQFAVRAGSVADPEGKAGTASLTAALLRKGTTTRSADQVSAALDFIGAHFDASAGPDFSSGSAEFLKKDLAGGLDLLADLMLNPTFPAEEFTKLQKQSIEGIRSDKDDAWSVLGRYFNAYLFSRHPYGRPTSGDEGSLAAITRDDVVKFYQDYYSPANVVLAVVGDFSTPEMEKLLTARFAGWTATGKATPVPRAADAPPVAGKRLLLVDKPDATQTFYRIGNVGVKFTNSDRVPLEVVNTLFGGRFTSMLNSELRIKSGLTYGAGSFFDRRQARGPFAILSFTANQNTEEALDMTLDVLRRLHEKGITAEELSSAQSYLKGQFPLDIETSDQLAELLAELELYGLDEREINQYYARVDAVTLEDARRVIREHYPLENLVFVLIGKAGEIEPVAAKYAAQLDRKSISAPGF